MIKKIRELKVSSKYCIKALFTPLQKNLAKHKQYFIRVNLFSFANVILLILLFHSIKKYFYVSFIYIAVIR